MGISNKIINSIERSSWIRKMFEEGAKLKEKFGDENIFNFSLGNPDIEPPPEFYNCLKEVSSNSSQGIHGYMPNAGYPDTRKNIAEKVSKDLGKTVDFNSIVMTCGAAGGLNIIFKTILNPGDQVIVPRPYFIEYSFYVENHGGELVPVDTNEDFSLNVTNISNAINSKTKAVLITSPNNPTGRVYPEDQIEALSGVLKSYSNGEIFLIADEPYREIIYDNIKVPSIFKHYFHSIITTSYSKSLSIPGERIGYVAVNPDCKDFNLLMNGLILSNRILGYVNAPALMQRIVTSLNEVSVNIDAYQARRDLFVNGLQSAGYDFIKPEGAFYIFCKSPIEDDMKFVNHLQKYNILAVPGSGFGQPGYFRIAFCVPEDTIKRSIPKFKEAIESI